MSEQAAKLSSPCQECGEACVGWAVQLIKNGRLRWEIEWACDTCGISHGGGWGWAPEDVRARILEQHGSHCVRLTGDRRTGGKILKVFRDAFNVSIQKSTEMARQLRQRGYDGTYVEVDFISELLRIEGISSEIFPGPCK